MIEAWLAKVGWKTLLPYVVILVLAGALWGVWGWKESAEADAKAAEKLLDDVVQINADNANAVRRMQDNYEADRVATQQELQAAQDRQKTIETIKKEQRNAPDANDVVSPYDRDFFERVRKSKGGG